MDCYTILVALAKNGYDKIKIDLEQKTLKIGKKTIIEGGEVKQHKINGNEFDALINEPLDMSELYEQYKYSLPSERDGGRHYFKALPASELTDAQLVLGMPRLEARVRLEAYVLLAAMSNMISWTDGHWFWQGQDKDFVILKKYI